MVQIPQSMDLADGGLWGGGVEPSKFDTSAIRDRVLRSAVEAAYAGWARKYPELLEDLDD